MTEKTAYQEGQEAHAAGKRRRDNQYSYRDPKHEQWDEGWVDADVCAVEGGGKTSAEG